MGKKLVAIYATTIPDKLVDRRPLEIEPEAEFDETDIPDKPFGGYQNRAERIAAAVARGQVRWKDEEAAAIDTTAMKMADVQAGIEAGEIDVLTALAAEEARGEKARPTLVDWLKGYGGEAA